MTLGVKLHDREIRSLGETLRWDDPDRRNMGGTGRRNWHREQVYRSYILWMWKGGLMSILIMPIYIRPPPRRSEVALLLKRCIRIQLGGISSAESLSRPCYTQVFVHKRVEDWPTRQDKTMRSPLVSTPARIEHDPQAELQYCPRMLRLSL